MFVHSPPTWQTNMTERVRSCFLQSPHLANAHVRLCLGKHIRRVYMRLQGVFQLATCMQDITFKRVFLETDVFTIFFSNFCVQVPIDARMRREHSFEREFYALRRGMQNSKFVFPTKQELFLENNPNTKKNVDNHCITFKKQTRPKQPL